MKKRYANRHKLNHPNSDLIYLLKSVEDKNFKGDISFYDFKNTDIKITTPKGKIIIDKNYKLLEFYDYSSKIKLSTFYDKDNNIIEWYFDIANEIGKENGVPYEEDLYLDVVVKANGDIVLLDEDELEDALKTNDITKEQYEMAYKEANNLIDILKVKKEKLRSFTNYYLNCFE